MTSTIAALFHAHRTELTQFLWRRLRDRQAAADLVQDAFLRLAERNDKLDLVNARAYLFRIASNLAVDHERRRARRVTLHVDDDQVGDVVDDQPGPEDRAQGRERLAHVNRALSRLPDLTRNVIQLVRMDGLSYAQAARQLGVSESSVQKHLAKGVAHAAAALADNTPLQFTGSEAGNVLHFRMQDKAADD